MATSQEKDSAMGFKALLLEIKELEEKLAQVAANLSKLECKNCKHTLEDHWSEKNRNPGQCFRDDSTGETSWCQCKGFEER